MPRLRVFAMVDLPPFVMGPFESHFEVIKPAGADWHDEIAPAKPDAVLCSINSRLDAAAIQSLPSSVRAIATYSVGYDHVDVHAARERGIAVFNTPGVLAESVADAALLLILGAARRVTESIDLIRGRGWKGWTASQLLGAELDGKRLGILGMGDIGRRVARRARGFGMTIAYTNRSDLGASDALFVGNPHELLESSDIFLLACPATRETRRFINAKALERAKTSLIVVNIARGDLIDDDALIEALTSNRILAAGLDVYSGEPAIDPRYFALPNVFMLPHIGSSTVEARIRMGLVLVNALKDLGTGVKIPNQVV